MNFEMNVVMASLLLAAGLVLLWKAADLLVGGAVGLASKFGISPLVIGLTVVAMGTSAPEVAASIAAAAGGYGDTAIGNVFGSNVANLALVGGIIALLAPITVSKSMLKREMPAMLLSALLLWPILRNKYLDRIEGVILLAVFAALIYLTVRFAKKQRGQETTDTENPEPVKEKHVNTLKAVLFIIIGLAGLAFGAQLTIKGAVFIGMQIGLSEAVIGLTIIAIGTSLPELITCVVASLKGHNDLSIGNLVGSNIFNTLLVTSTAGLVRPFEVTARLAGLDYWIMIAVSAGFVILAVVGRCRINKTGGVILLCTYIVYMVYLLAPVAGN